ncbi:MAG: hypothetical protein SGI92_14305 [Bryobacteraceae bacterium]|nr:hypothetical protein [Bryobacteraceae bacterium]
MAHECRRLLWAGLIVVLCTRPLAAADAVLDGVLARLERLEAENVKLREEVTQLKARLDGTAAAPASAPVEERLAVAEQRIEEQQQTKVESEQHVPVKLKGMVLFNAYMSGRNGTPQDFPTVATANRGAAAIRGTMRNSSIGLEVQSPYHVAGAEARGEIMLDFYGNFEEFSTPRIRTGFVDLQWPSTGLRFGIEKPIVAPRNPSSLAQFIYPALWGTGNLWLWQPQVRVEQKFHFGGNDLRVQAGLLQTNDQRALNPASPIVLQPRPAWEGRIAWSRKRDDDHAVEFAPGFHYSRTLVQGTSLPSQLVTADWRIAPARAWEITGAMFTGRNAGPIGGIRQGIVAVPAGGFRSVGTTGGWSQLMYRPVDRLRFHAMAGTQDDRSRDLNRGNINRNFSWILNSMYQLGPNVVVGLEMQQIRTDYLGLPTRVLNRYDLALGYIF